MADSMPSPQLSDDSIVWVISGDAAKENGQREGIGAFWYGLWWCVPLASIPGLFDLHITCLELMEVGLGVVVVGPLLAKAKRVRLVSDALVAVLLLSERELTTGL